jgi:hypothetical protein
MWNLSWAAAGDPFESIMDFKKSAVEVWAATITDLDDLVLLFDAYRRFCRQPSEPSEQGAS